MQEVHALIIFSQLIKYSYSTMLILLEIIYKLTTVYIVLMTSYMHGFVEVLFMSWLYS